MICSNRSAPGLGESSQVVCGSYSMVTGTSGGSGGSGAGTGAAGRPSPGTGGPAAGPVHVVGCQVICPWVAKAGAIREDAIIEEAASTAPTRHSGRGATRERRCGRGAAE